MRNEKRRQSSSVYSSDQQMNVESPTQINEKQQRILRPLSVITSEEYAKKEDKISPIYLENASNKDQTQ